MTSEDNEPIENGIRPSNRFFARPLIETHKNDDDNDGDDDDYYNMAFKDSTLHKNQLIHHLEPTTPPLLSDDAEAHHVVGCGSHKYTRLVRVPMESGTVPVRALLSSRLRDRQKENI